VLLLPVLVRAPPRKGSLLLERARCSRTDAADILAIRALRAKCAMPGAHTSV